MTIDELKKLAGIDSTSTKPTGENISKTAYAVRQKEKKMGLIGLNYGFHVLTLQVL